MAIDFTELEGKDLEEAVNELVASYQSMVATQPQEVAGVNQRIGVVPDPGE